MEIAVNVKALHNETESLLVGRVPLVRSQDTWVYSLIQIVCDFLFADFFKPVQDLRHATRSSVKPIGGYYTAFVV